MTSSARGRGSDELSSSASPAESNLPSRLTPMEQLHLLRDDDLHPNTILARLILEGEIRRDLFEQALHYVAARHEMMTAQLAGDGKVWEARSSKQSGKPAQPNLVFNWHDVEYDPDTHKIQPVRLQPGPGCQCDIFVGPSGVNLLMQMHHARVDGLGAIQGIRETLQVYNNLCTDQPIDHGLRRLNRELFTRRGRIGVFQKGWWKRILVQWIPIYGASKFALAKISHLMPNWNRETELEPLVTFPSHCHRNFEPAVYEQLREGDRSSNDRLLASLFLAVDRFQSELKQSASDKTDKRSNKKIRIVVPINVRDRADLRGTMCNRVALIQLDRGDRDFADPEGLVWGINYELGIVSKYKFEKSFGIVLRIMAMVPPFFRWRMKHRSIRATTVLTNLGNPFRNLKLPRENGCLLVGDMKLVDVELLPPVYDLTPAVFLFSTYAGRPAITVNYDQRVITPEQAERLLDIYFEEIHRIVDHLPS